jgi:arsenite methyltransferase
MSEHAELPSTTEHEEIKTCCASLYQSDLARLLLGETFHPGGEELTVHLGKLLRLTPASRVLDVACGPGTSALLLAERLGCRVLGLDYGVDNVQRANARAHERNLAHLVTFQQGDAEHLPFPGATFDALLCECAFCTFPEKAQVANEFWRVLKPGGQLGMSDLTRSGKVPPELQGLLAWISCIADALPVERYTQILSDADLRIERVEQHDEALLALVHEIQGKLLGAELLFKLQKVELPSPVDFAQAKVLAREASAAIRAGKFGYMALLARKPEEPSPEGERR